MFGGSAPKYQGEGKLARKKAKLELADNGEYLRIRIFCNFETRPVPTQITVLKFSLKMANAAEFQHLNVELVAETNLPFPLMSS